MALAGAIRTTLGSLGVRLMLEPGRWLAGPAGLLLASVVLVKRDGASRFVVLDAGMNDLVRPAMYDAWHGIVPLSAVDALGTAAPADVVGPVCETGDTFARSRMLPDLAPNARVAFLDAGAYGSVMSSTYNARPLAAEAMVDGERWTVIRERQSYEAMWAGDRVPEWLAASLPADPGRGSRTPSAPLARAPRPRALHDPLRAALARAMARARRRRAVSMRGAPRSPAPTAWVGPCRVACDHGRRGARAFGPGRAGSGRAGSGDGRPAAGARFGFAAPAAFGPDRCAHRLRSELGGALAGACLASLRRDSAACGSGSRILGSLAGTAAH